MNQSIRLAQRFREVMLDGRWVANTNFMDQLSKINLKQATSKIGEHNSIAALAFHVSYYIEGVLNVFKGGNLEIRDKYSFNMPEFESEEGWQEFLSRLWTKAEEFAMHIESLEESKLSEVFVDEKYGTYQRNIEGMIEHCYYHLGQVTLISKLTKEL